MTWSSVFGMVEDASLASRQHRMVPGTPILRISNVRDEEGNLKASFSKGVPLTSDAEIQYNPETRRPVWHTDSTFRANPPIGSVFHCRQAPPEGAQTLFADTRQAHAGLDAATKVLLDEMEAVCSLAHHDKKMPLHARISAAYGRGAGCQSAEPGTGCPGASCERCAGALWA